MDFREVNVSQHCTSNKNQQGNMLIVFLYVDDFFFIGDFGIKEFKSVMKDEFEITDLGLMRCFLGIEVH